MGEITLRPATERDESFVNQLTRHVMREYVQATWDTDEDREHYYELDRFDQATTQIIQYDGTDIGRISVTRSDEGLGLDEIHIRPEYQGRGIGASVILGVLEEASTKGVPVELSVLKINPVKRLYERLGFRIHRQDENRLYMRKTI